MGGAPGWGVDEPSTSHRAEGLPDEAQQTPEEAAWALRNEVVRLEVSYSSGSSWSHPIRFSDYLALAKKYLRERGLDISKFRWPYSNGN